MSAQAHHIDGGSKVARAFGLEGETWLKHANAASVWTRFSVVSLFALAVWSREWIGIWCLVPITLSIVWMFVNPLLFAAPASTRNWASRTVLGERIWVDRDKVDLPEQFRSRAASLIANAYSAVGLAILVYGLVDLNVLAAITGILITHGGKAWYLDRVQLLFFEMKARNPGTPPGITDGPEPASRGARAPS